VFKRSVETTLAGCVLAVAVPILAFSALMREIQVRLPALARRLGHKQDAGRSSWMRIPAEFEFAHAIEAYEELIDATLADRRS